MPITLNSVPGLLEFLQSQGKLNKEAYSTLVEEFKDKGVAELEKAIIDRHLMDEMGLARVKAEGLGMTYVDLIGKDIDEEVLRIIPKTVAQNYEVVAYAKEGTRINVAYVDPLNTAAVEAMGFLMAERNMISVPSVTSKESYKFVLKKYDVLEKEVARVLETAEEKEASEKEKAKEEEEFKLEETIKGAPVSRIVSVIMRYAVEMKASDIHIEVLGNKTRVRYRIDGILRSLLSLPLHMHNSVVSRIKVLANLKLDETRIPQDGRISRVIGGKKIDFRLSTLPIQGGTGGMEKVVMRVLDTSAGVPTLDQLGFRERYKKVLQEEARRPHGMMLITGPTGSGKSTTLFTMLGMINEEAINISTLENPVEYFLPGINQSQIRPEVDFTFSGGLRALLRQDPDVIMVGEIRDKETGELAVHASLTGHMIFSTLHTNDALGVVPRLTDMGVEPFLLSATLNVIIAQRLARKICEHCKTEDKIPEKQVDQVRESIKDIPDDYFENGLSKDGELKFFKGSGCIRCGDTGYKGRSAVAELIQVTQELRKLMNSGFPEKEVKEEIARQGWITLQQDGFLKTLEGITTVEEVLRLSKET